MLKEYMDAYIELGEDINDARVIFGMNEYFEIDPDTGVRLRLNIGGSRNLRAELQKILTLANRLSLPVTRSLVERRIGHRDSLPQTVAEFDVLIEALKDEMNSRIFLSVPAHLSSYYEADEIVSDAVMSSFPKATEEIRAAGNCLAVGEHTACVFHAMRAAEIGVRGLGTAPEIKQPRPIEQMEWQAILNGMKSRIEAIENQPHSSERRDADLQFYSEAAAQFRFFKNGWRIRVAHARAIYSEIKAKEAIDHVRSFFEILVPRLSEEP